MSKDSLGLVRIQGELPGHPGSDRVIHFYLWSHSSTQIVEGSLLGPLTATHLQHVLSQRKNKRKKSRNQVSNHRRNRRVSYLVGKLSVT